MGSISAGLFMLIVVGILFCLIPFFIAQKRQHKYKWIILILCLFSISGITWLIALVWSLWPQNSAVATPIMKDATGLGKYKKCPECAEVVMLDARKCKHCGSEIVLAPDEQSVSEMPVAEQVQLNQGNQGSEIKISKKHIKFFIVMLAIMGLLATYEQEIANIFRGMFATKTKAISSDTLGAYTPIGVLPSNAVGRFSNNYEKNDRCSSGDKYLTVIQPKKVLGYELHCDITSIKLSKDGRYFVDELCRSEGYESNRTQILEVTGKETLIIDADMYTRCH